MKKNVMTHFLLLVLVIMGSIALMANKQQEPNKDKDSFFYPSKTLLRLLERQNA